MGRSQVPIHSSLLPVSLPRLPRVPADKEYYVLGGQHLVAALQMLRRDRLAERLDPPRALSVVQAKILAHHTPKKFREAAAGDAQFAQSGIQALPLSGWAEQLLTEDVRAEGDPVRRLAMAVQKSGLNRTMTTVCPRAPCWPQRMVCVRRSVPMG